MGGKITKKHDDNGTIVVLGIQTTHMANTLTTVQPWLFEIDTTHKTCEENYKLMAPVYLNVNTNKWDVAGLYFLATEELPNVEHAIDMFKASITYVPLEKFIYPTR